MRRMRIIFPAAVIAGLLVTVPSCVSPPPEPPRPVPTFAPPPALPPAPPAPAAADWRDWPVTPGTWTYARDGRGSRAAFGGTRLVMRCDLAERRIYLSRGGSGAAPLAVRTSSTTRAVPVRAGGGGGTSSVAAVFTPTDPLLDAMAFSRGRFAIEQAGAPTLVVPAWAEIGRVVEDCRG